MSEEEIAKAGYEAYGASVGWKNYQGLQMPKWEQLTPAIRSGWLANNKRVTQLAPKLSEARLLKEG